MLSLLKTLVEMYTDNGIGKYFDNSHLEYYDRRYKLCLFLVPSVGAIAVILGVIIGRGT